MKGVNIIFHLCMGLKNQNQFAVSVNSKFIIAVKNCYDLLSILLGDSTQLHYNWDFAISQCSYSIGNVPKR